MAVRVKIKIDSTGGKSLKTVALVNTGFETLKPQLLLPIKAASDLSIWPNLPTEAKVEIYDTAGGPMRVYIVPDSAWVSLLAEEQDSENRKAKPSVSEANILSDMVISHTEVEVLISDKLAGRLKVAIEDAGEGIWRFRDDLPDEERKSELPEYWT